MKRSMFYVVVAAIQSLGSIGAPLVAARVIGPSQLGVVAVGMLGVILVRAASSLGLYGPISVKLHEGGTGPREAIGLLRWSGLRCLVAGYATALVGIAVGGLSSSICFAAAGGFAGAVALGHQSLHRSQTHHPAYAAAMLGPTALAHIAGLISVFAIAPTARTYLGAMAFASLLVASALHLQFAQRAPVVPRAVLRQALHLGYPLVLTAASTVGLSLSDRPVIQGFLGEAASGRYHLVYILAAGGVPLLAALNNAWLPAVLNQPDERRLEVLSTTITDVVIWMSVLTVGAAIATPALVRLIGGEEFVTSGTATVSAIVAISVVPYAVYSGMSIGLLSTKQTDGIALSMVVAAGVNLALNFALIPTLGLVGAGIASVVGYSLAAQISWRRLGGASKVAWLTRPAAAAFLTCLGALAVSVYLPVYSPTALTIRLILGAALGVLSCIAVARSTSSHV